MTEIEVRQLVSYVNSDKYIKMYRDSEGKRNQRTKMWGEITDLIGTDLSSEVVRTKYKSLYGDYKKVLFEAKKTGAATPRWKYFDLFRANIRTMDDVFMPNVRELGDPENNIPPFNFSDVDYTRCIDEICECPKKETKILDIEKKSTVESESGEKYFPQHKKSKKTSFQEKQYILLEKLANSVVNEDKNSHENNLIEAKIKKIDDKQQKLKEDISEILNILRKKDN